MGRAWKPGTGVPTALAACALFGLIALSSTGCTPSLAAVSTPPPTKTARLYSKQPLFQKLRYYANLSTGVALAFTCTHGDPCKNAKISIDDPTVVKVLPAHLARLEMEPLRRDSLPPSTFLLVGLQPGNTTVRLRASGADATIAVTVRD